MKTLKRTLCLVLVLVMVAGLVAVNAAAAFPDADEIEYTEAAGVMNGLKIIQGRDTGDFDPKGDVTRAEISVMVYKAITGDTDAKLVGQYAVNSFDDVAASAWYAGYVGYAAQKNIVKGYGDGNFGPNDNVTGYQALVMVLRALGYDAAKAGNEITTAPNWKTAAMERAQSLGITANLAGVDFNANATREVAAEIIYRAFQLNPQAWSTLLDAYNNSGVPYITAPTKFAGQAVTAVGKNAKDELEATTAAPVHTFVVESYDALGRFYDVYAKADGTVLYAEDVTVEVAITASMTAKQVQDAFKAASVTTNKVAGYTSVQNGAIGAAGAAITLGTTKGSDAGVAGTYYVYNKAIQAVKLADTVIASKVTAIDTTAGAETITLAGVGAVQNNATTDNILEYSGIAKNDIVYYVLIAGTYEVTKAETVDGKITKVDGTKLTVGGKVYNASAITDNSGLADDATDFTNEFRLYLDKNGDYFAVTYKPGEAPEVETTLVYAVSAYNIAGANDEYGNPTGTKYYIQAVDMTGAEVKYQVLKATHDAFAAGLYDVTVAEGTDTGNGNMKADYATFTAAPVAAAATDKTSADTQAVAIAKNDTKTTIAGNNYYFDDSQVILYVTGTGTGLKVETATGKNAIAAVTYYLYGEKTDTTSRNYTVKYIVVEAAKPAPETAQTGKGLIFADEAAASTTTVPYTKADGSVGTAYVHVVYIDGVKTEINMATNTAVNGIYNYTTDSVTGLYTMGAAYDAANIKAGAITNNYNGKITNGAATDLDVNAATIVNVSGNAKADGLTAADLAATETVTVILDAKGVATFVYITGSTRA